MRIVFLAYERKRKLLLRWSLMPHIDTFYKWHRVLWHTFPTFFTCEALKSVFWGLLEFLTPKRKVSCLQLQDNGRLLERESCLYPAYLSAKLWKSYKWKKNLENLKKMKKARLQFRVKVNQMSLINLSFFLICRGSLTYNIATNHPARI